MRAYAEQDEENMRARAFLKQWRDDGLLSLEQYEQLQAETSTKLRSTNVFLRITLLVFTLFAVAMAVTLFFVLTDVRLSGPGAGVCFVVFAAMSYFAAESIVSQVHHYRHGMEEAFAIASVVLFSVGLALFFVSERNVHLVHDQILIASVIGAVAAGWIWYRFGPWYALPAAMGCIAFGATEWTASHVAARCLIVLLYAAGLIAVAAVSGRHRFDYLRQHYSVAEAFLWFGVYVALNLQLSAVASLAGYWSPVPRTSGFYWATWVLVWCLPVAALTRGVRTKDRWVLATGMLTALLTLMTNKPYLGWQRHTWDPMLLGILLVGVAVVLLRWLGRGPDGVRYGFTADRMSKRHKQAFGVASSVMGFATQHAAIPAQRDAEFESGFGGGSGGGGASGDF